jgi:putative ABC transport system permease protein
MFKAIIVSAVRNLFRNISFTVINLTGLAISMSLALLIIVVIKGQYSFDRYHKDAERIYRINTEALRVNGDVEPYASVPLAVATVLEDNYAFADETVKLDRRFNGTVSIGDSRSSLRGLFAEQSFLEMFNFPLEAGNVQMALTRPHTVILTDQTAERLFGKDDPVGKIITMEPYGDFTVTGVLKRFQGPTHFEFQALASYSSFESLQREGTIRSIENDWQNYYSGYAYIKLKAGISPGDVEEGLAEISSARYKDVQFETRDKGYRFFLQPLTGITPGPALSNNMGRGMPDILLIFLGILAAIVMAMACFNYTQLTIAKSLTRAREIGIRKIVGAHRFQVFVQLILEGIVFSLVALMLAYILLQLIKPGFEQLHINREYEIDLTEDWVILLLFAAFAFLVGLIAGLLPAGYISAFRPLDVVKNSLKVKVGSRLTLRQILMVTQFTISFVFITVIVTVYRQVNFMISADYGINETGIMNIPLQGNDFEILSTEIEKLAGVMKVGGVSHRMGTWADGSSDYKRRKEDELFSMRDFSVDENFVDNIGLRFVAGRNFLPAEKNSVILNEEALRAFGFQSASESIGQALFVGDSTELIVRGVVSDFHFRPFSYQIGPLALRYDPSRFDLLSVKIGGNKEVMVAKIEAVWKRFDNRPFSWAMMEDEIDQAYADAGMHDVVSIIGYITLIAITLSCLGMLGMVMYNAETRVKEIGVRKILGASVKDVLTMLSRSFIYMLLLAVMLGTPLSYFLGNIFLEQYAYKVPLSFGIIIGGAGLLALLSVIVIGSQTWRAATSNPVNSLRHE